jgi:hypothetical protein
MESKERRSPEGSSRGGTARTGSARLLSTLLVAVAAFTQVPVVSAHGTTGGGGLSQEHGVLLALIGVVVLGGFVVLKRTGRVTPTTALYGVFVGITITALGAVLFEGLSPDPTYTARSMPFPRAWYQPLALLSGLGIMVASLIVGGLRWPSRPRYTFLGILMGVWIAYPYLLPGVESGTNPLGYVIVLGTPILVGYVVWKDAGSAIRAVMRDPVARRFGIGVGAVLALFFVSVTGYLSFFPEEGFPEQVTVVVLPVIYQLVQWPTLEIAIPHLPFIHLPFFLAVSPGQVIVVGMLSTLIGLNAALIARHWRVEERAGMTEGTAGSAAIVGTCTCGCCGPLVAKIAVLAAGPSIAAPLYWVFVDSASPLSAAFIVGSLLLFTGSLIYSVQTARQPDQSATILPAD